MGNEQSLDRVLRIVWRNRTNHSTRLRLRGVSGSYEMAYGVSCEVRARGPATGTVTVEQVEDGAILTGWPGCVLSVHSLKLVGGPSPEQSLPAVAPTIALLRRVYGVDDDEDTLV